MVAIATLQAVTRMVLIRLQSMGRWRGHLPVLGRMLQPLATPSGQ